MQQRGTAASVVVVLRSGVDVEGGHAGDVVRSGARRAP